MGTMRKRLRDWWRGYTDFDVIAAEEIRAAAAGARPGSMFPITPGQLRALMALPPAQRSVDRTVIPTSE